MKILQNILQFLFLFAIIISASYLAHIGLINTFSLDRNIEMINLSYIFNSIFTIILAVAIVLVSKRFKDQLGFIFMGGSLVKIGIFMAIIKLNGFEINKKVFLDFFIAYLICLIVEVYYVARILNNIK